MQCNDSVFQRAKQVFTPALHFYYPLSVVRGQGPYVCTDDGRRFLDFSSGLAVLNIGHNHPRVVDAASAQMASLAHTGGVYLNETTVAAAEKLLSILPGGLDRLFFSNSGAEAVDGALKLARYVTGRQGIISFTGAFHGRTFGALSVTTSSAAYRKGYHPLLPSVYQTSYPYCFRCPYRQDPASCRRPCFSELETIIMRRIPADEIAAVIIEPVLGEGGYVPAPPSFLAALRVFCDRHGILLVFDEVQSGMGRSGRWFACEHSGVSPDIMTVAKGIASGYPLSAVVAKKEIMEQWPSGAHGTTFGGNPVSCAASMATIDVIREEGLLVRSSEIGAEILERLRRLADSYPLVGDVRGYGYMIGIEFSGTDGAPNGAACRRVMDACLEKGLVLIGCGLERNVIRFIPPLNVSREDMETALSILEEAIQGLQ